MGRISVRWMVCGLNPTLHAACRHRGADRAMEFTDAADQAQRRPSQEARQRHQRRGRRDRPPATSASRSTRSTPSLVRCASPRSTPAGVCSLTIVATVGDNLPRIDHGSRMSSGWAVLLGFAGGALSTAVISAFVRHYLPSSNQRLPGREEGFLRVGAVLRRTGH